MIYVTVGNHDQPFDRLIMEMDRLAQKFPDVRMQIGCGVYVPQIAKWERFFPLAEAEGLIARASVVVAHAGIGTIISARKAGTPLIICPRRKGRGEHFNDHQLEICRELIARPKPFLDVAMEPGELEEKLSNMEEKSKHRPKAPFEDPAVGLKKTIREFLAGL
jgi:UDP-N-acetylglucosamine transferase subunit ALG13